MFKSPALVLALTIAALTACTNNGGGGASTTNPDGTPVDIMSDFPAGPRDNFALNLESQSVKSDVSNAELLAVFEARNRSRNGFENPEILRFSKSWIGNGTDTPERTAKLAIAANCDINRGKDMEPNFESGSTNAEVVSTVSGAACPVDISMKSSIGFQSNAAEFKEKFKANPNDKSVLLGNFTGSKSETRTVRDATLRELLDEASSRNSMSTRGVFNASNIGSGSKTENAYMRMQSMNETTSASGFVYRVSCQAETVKNADESATQMLVTITTRAGILRIYRIEDNRESTRSNPDHNKTLINGVKATSDQEYFLRDKIFDEVKQYLRF